ncbi:MAG: HAD-IA family hydrolase [Candidatus Diapherotrites archaeon]|nr:HAD-IA family hydrolase [Candidatus Diapherotrites archaeon]
MIKTIMFDLDGTLIDTKRSIVHAFNTSLRKMGYNAVPEEKIIALIGRPIEDMYRYLVNPKDTDSLCTVYRKEYARTSVKNSQLFPGVTHTLNELSNYKLAIVTTKRTNLAKQLCDASNITRFFDIIIGGDLVRNPKPAPDAIILAAEKLNTPPSHSLFVGDTCIDVNAGKRAGTKTCGVTYGIGKKDELKKCKADFIVDDISEIKQVVSMI